MYDSVKLNKCQLHTPLSPLLADDGVPRTNFDFGSPFGNEEESKLFPRTSGEYVAVSVLHLKRLSQSHTDVESPVPKTDNPDGPVGAAGQTVTGAKIVY